MKCMIFVLLGLSSPVSAEIYGAEYEACSRGSTLEIIDCISARTKSWDGALNTAYKSAMAQADPAQREPLRDAQRLWIAYRDANCRFYGSQEGSIRQIEAAECLRFMTEARARELQRTAQQH